MTTAIEINAGISVKNGYNPTTIAFSNPNKIDNQAIPDAYNTPVLTVAAMINVIKLRERKYVSIFAEINAAAKKPMKNPAFGLIKAASPPEKFEANGKPKAISAM